MDKKSPISLVGNSPFTYTHSHPTLTQYTIVAKKIYHSIPTKFKMRGLLVLGVAVLCTLGNRVRAHPLCHYDARPPDPDMFLLFCPEQEDGACCNEIEEAEVITWYNEEVITTDACGEYFREVCSSISRVPWIPRFLLLPLPSLCPHDLCIHT